MLQIELQFTILIHISNLMTSRYYSSSSIRQRGGEEVRFIFEFDGSEGAPSSSGYTSDVELPETAGDLSQPLIRNKKLFAGVDVEMLSL